MRDLGNTLIVVEHDEDTMMQADWLIDVGPGAGEFGGEIIASGTPKQVAKNKNPSRVNICLVKIHSSAIRASFW